MGDFRYVQAQGEKQSWVDWRTLSPYKVTRDVYYGQGGVGDPSQPSYVVPNSSELYYRTRVTLTPYTPWFALFIDSQYEPLYTEEPPRYPQDMSEGMESFVQNCNRGGMSLDEFKMNVTFNGLLDGAVFIGSGYDGDTSKQPWLYYYTAQQLNTKLTETDQFGAVTLYVFTEQVDKDVYIHNVYTDSEYAKYQSNDPEQLGEMQGEAVQSMPINAIYTQRREQGELLPHPKALSVAGLCIAVYNAESDQRWVLRVQGHSIFVVTSDIAPKGLGDGLTSVLHIDTADSAGGAEFVAPPAELSKEHRESKAELLGQLFEVMRHHGVIAQRSSQLAESGTAKSFTFRPVNTAIAKSRSIAKQIDEYTEDMMYYYTGQDVEFEVIYKTDFTPSAGVSMLELLDALTAFKQYGNVEAVKGVLKQMAMYVEAGESAEAEIENVRLDGVLDAE